MTKQANDEPRQRIRLKFATSQAESYLCAFLLGMLNIRSLCCFFFLGACFFFGGFAFGTQLQAQSQPTSVVDTSKKEEIFIDNADKLQIIRSRSGESLQRLIGQVELSQDSIYMYCDSADLIESVQLYAFGNVIIQQGDSIAAFAEQLDYNSEEQVAYLKKEVLLKNGDRLLYTNELTYDLATKLATYTTGGRLTDGATELRSTYGYYYTDREEIFFRDSVVVVGENFALRADTLRYDVRNEIVYFPGPTIIRTDSAEIYCEGGYYNVATEQALFHTNAQYRSGEQIAAADSIAYEGASRIYTLSGQAYVREADRSFARAERIEYDKQKETYKLQGNSLLRDGDRTVRGENVRYNKISKQYAVSGGRAKVLDGNNILESDQLDFDEESGLGLAQGNVIWQDTAAQLTILAQRASFNQEKGYVKADGGRNGRPLLITILDGDSLFLAADTLFSYEEITSPAAPENEANILETNKREDPDNKNAPKEENHEKIGQKPAQAPLDSLANIPIDSSTQTLEQTSDSLAITASPEPDTQRIIKAYRDVRIFKSDMQAVADSMSFNTNDSIISLFYEPILWQDSSQLLADTIDAYLHNDALEKVHLKRKALVLTTPDLIYFNQVKGKDIVAYFDSSALKRTAVSGNAEAIYYIQDDEQAYIGVNKTTCSEMTIDFEQGSVRFLRFITQPDGKLDPMATVSPSTQPKLEGFKWELKRRPQSLEDLFTKAEAPAPPPLQEVEEEEEATPATKKDKSGIEN